MKKSGVLAANTLLSASALVSAGLGAEDEVRYTLSVDEERGGDEEGIVLLLGGGPGREQPPGEGELGLQLATVVMEAADDAEGGVGPHLAPVFPAGGAQGDAGHGLRHLPIEEHGGAGQDPISLTKA